MFKGTMTKWPVQKLTQMNSFNKTEAAVFPCRLCFLRAFPFRSLIYRIILAVTYMDFTYPVNTDIGPSLIH